MVTCSRCIFFLPGPAPERRQWLKNSRWSGGSAPWPRDPRSPLRKKGESFDLVDSWTISSKIGSICNLQPGWFFKRPVFYVRDGVNPGPSRRL